MFCVQADGCAPIVRAFDRGDEFAEPWTGAQTVAAGMRVPGAIGDYLILRALRESGGGAITVTDEEILSWMGRVASLEGIFVCPEGAATAAAVPKLLSRGSPVRRRDRAAPEHRLRTQEPGASDRNLGGGAIEG